MAQSKIYVEGDRSFDLVVRTLKFIPTIKIDGRMNSILDQLVKSSSSVGANIAEGRGGCSRKEMARFYKIALKSSNETNYLLRIIQEVACTDSIKIKTFIEE